MIPKTIAAALAPSLLLLEVVPSPEGSDPPLGIVEVPGGIVEPPGAMVDPPGAIVDPPGAIVDIPDAMVVAPAGMVVGAIDPPADGVGLVED